VSFGSVPAASVLVLSDSAVVATAPARRAAATVDVTLTTKRRHVQHFQQR